MLPAAASSFAASRWLFLRLLGIVYLAAFVSLWIQVDGLIGSNGILPVRDFLHGGDAAWPQTPSLCWLAPCDRMLHALCAAGTICAALLLLGFLPAPMLIVSWMCYLSLAVAGQVFLGYQWDVLLLETGVLAIFFAPWGWRPGAREAGRTTYIVRWLLRWLLFRLMFAAGLVKLASGDMSWRDLTALHVHYETQPLPSWASWHMHQLPGWFHSASVLVTYLLELGLPILLFGPSRLRHLACFGIAAFQLLIFATGNFGFFNLLVLALCVAQLDDSVFPAGMRRWLGLPKQSAGPADEAPARQALTWAFAGLVGLLSLVPLLSNLGLDSHWPGWFREAQRTAAAFRLVNQYGMFAIMTTSRREIVIEGSAAGKTWHVYEFRWKPGDVSRPPPVVGLHLPRLDWQMWFAALDGYEQTSWFDKLLDRLLAGSPEVLALLERNPFPEQPPQFIRATVYEYRFTTREERGETGACWRRRQVALYCPVRSR